MNATCKRLLSWLVVLTMVLSMVPVLDLSNFAVTTQAVIDEDNQAKIDAAATVIAAAKNLGAFAAPENGATTITKDCPVCGPDQEWTALSGTGLAAEVFTKADSKITHHHYYLSDNATFSGSAMTAGGGNNHYVCLNLNGKTLTTGAVAITTNYGNIFNIMDTVGTGVLAGKSAGASAAAINVQNPNAKVNIYGGTIKRATGSHAYSSVAYIQGLGGQINLYDGTIDGTGINNTSYATVATLTANDGRTGTFNVYGGEVKCGTTTGDGNIQVKANAVFNVYGGTVKDGVARGGGNFNVNGTGVLNVHGGTISGGQANKSTNITVSGGNIILTSGGTLNMDGGVICGGTTTAHGGNIQIRRDQVGHIDITGGKIYGGTAGNGNGHNIYAYSTTTGSTLNIGGTAEIAGDIYAGAGVTTTLSGTPKIKTSGLTDAQGNPVTAKNGGLTVGTTIDASGVTGGEIQVTADLNKVLTDAFENAATVAQYFEATGAKLAVAANTEKKLVIIEDAPQVGKFEPWKYEGLAYCPVCGGSEPVEWMAIDREFVGGTMISANNAGKHDHVYLAEDISGDVAVGGYFLATGNNNRICLNLNGKKLNVTNGRAFMRNFCYAYWKVMDTEGGAEVSGNGVFRLDAAGNRTVDVYGGTFKTNGGNSIVEIGGNGGTFNLHNGTLDASGTDVGAISAQGKKTSGATATINVYGGEIIGNGDIAVRVGSILQAGGTEDAKIFLGTATFNMTAGSISGGFLMVRNDNTATISGGSIEYLTVVDGAYEENSSDNADVDYSGTTTVTLTGAVEIAQLNIGTNTLVNIDGLAEGADIAIVGAIGETLLTTANTTAQNCIKAYKPENFVVIDGNAISLVGAQAAVKTADGTVYFKTVDEAAATAEGGVLEIRTAEATVSVAEGKELYIDNRGNTVTVTGKGTLYAIDSANDDYNGYGAWIVEEGVKVANDVINPVNGNRYIVIKNPATGKYTAHRIEMYLTKVSLRAKAAGIYYRAAYKCDTTLAARIGAYGVALSLNAIPTLEAIQELDPAVQLTALEGFAVEMEGNTVDTTSAIVTNIFKAGVDNAARGNAAIYATPYVAIDFDGDGEYLADNGYVVAYEADNAAWNVENKSFAQKSMNDVLAGVPAVWETLTAAQQAANREIFSKWATEWSVELPEGFDAILNPEA